MSSYSTVVTKSAEASNILQFLGNVLGSTLNSPCQSRNLQLFLVFYSYFLLVWYGFQIPLEFYIVYPNVEFTPVRISLCLQKLCDILVPIVVVSQSLYDGGNFLKNKEDEMMFADRFLHAVGITIDFEKMKRIFKISVIFVTLYSAVLSSFTIFFTISLYSYFSLLVLVCSALFEISQKVYSIYINCYFCVSLLTFKCRFNHLTEGLKSMLKTDRKKNQLIINVKPYNSKYGDSVGKVKTIKLAYSIFRDLVSAHNKRFNIVLLLQYFQSVVVIIIGVYFLLCLVLSPPARGGGSDALITGTIGVTTSMAHCLFTVLFTTVCCAKTSFQANDVEGVVHELLCQVQENELKRELEDFSLQLLHSKVQITAHDLYTIDYTLLTQITGSVVSYVVIFMQFGSYDYETILDLSNNDTIAYEV